MDSSRCIVGREVAVDELGKSETVTANDVKALVKKAAAGNIEAFGELYSVYLDRIYRYVYYQVHNSTIAEDLTEEIFMKAWKGLRRYRWTGLPFSSWLYRIAHNHVVDYFRTNKQCQSLEEDIAADGDQPEEVIEKKQILQSLLQAISALPAQQRHIITLKFIGGLDNRRIERITGKHQGAIRVMQMRALTSLRHKLTEEMGQCKVN
jgi:RNA polymerase sigma-70 factor (ECF subfamily)